MRIPSLLPGLFLLALNAYGQETHTLGLDEWMNDHPDLRDRIVWIDENDPVAYSAWSADMKSELEQAVNGFMNSQYPFGLTGVPEVTEYGTGIYGVSERSAWVYYISYIAQSIAAEVTRMVPWSLDELGTTSLEVLFDSREMLYYSSYWNTYQFRYVTPAPPDFVFKFLEDNALIGQTRTGTIARVVEWCRRMYHYYYSSGVDQSNVYYVHWQYYGEPPVLRIIEGTVRTADQNEGHYTRGCHGTVQFIRTLLQTLNIPVKYIRAEGHAQPWFVHEDMYLSHGDDPYNTLARYNDVLIPAMELLIGQTEYQEHFGNQLTSQERLDNVGYRTRELGVEYLTLPFCRKRCEANNLGYDNLECYGLMSDYSGLDRTFTFQELNDLDFWNRMDAKIGSLGGCSANQGFLDYTPHLPGPRSDKAVLDLWFPGQTGSTVVDEGTWTVYAEIGAGYDRSQVIPHFCISEKATLTNYASGSVADLSSPKYFRVKAEDNTTRDWRVEITQSAETLDVIPDSRSVGPESGSTSFTVSASADWSVEDDAAWVTAIKSDVTTISVAYTANSSTESRTAYIRAFGSGGLEETVTLVQAGITITCEDSYEPNNIPENPTTSPFSTFGNSSMSLSVNGTIHDDLDRDFYMITIAESGTLGLELANAPLDYELTLFDLEGYRLASVRYLGGDTISQAIQSPGNYHFLVDGISGDHSCTEYTLNVSWEPDSAGEEECAVPDGLHIAEQSASGARLVWDSINGAINYQVKSRDALNQTWEYQDLASSSFDFTYQACGLEIELQVRAYCGGEAGYSDWSPGFTFTTPSCNCPDIYENNNDRTTASTSAFPVLGTGDDSATISGTIHTLTDEDFFTIHTTTPGTLTILLPDPPRDYELDLLDAGGGWLRTSSTNGSELIQYKVYETGHYYIRVYGFRGAGCCDPYRLTLHWHSEVTGRTAQKEPGSLVRVYPNPSDGKVIVETHLGTGERGTIELTGPTGQVLFRRPVRNRDLLNQEVFDLSRYPAGIYLIRITSSKGSIMKKLVLAD